MILVRVQQPVQAANAQISHTSLFLERSAANNTKGKVFLVTLVIPEDKKLDNTWLVRNSIRYKHHIQFSMTFNITIILHHPSHHTGHFNRNTCVTAQSCNFQLSSFSEARPTWIHTHCSLLLLKPICLTHWCSIHSAYQSHSFSVSSNQHSMTGQRWFNAMSY